MTIRRLILASMLLLGQGGISAAADPQWWAAAGWTHADAGLIEEGDGFLIGGGRTQPLGKGPLSLSYGLGFTSLKSSVTMLFEDPYAGGTIGPAEVTLLYLQPSLDLAVTFTVLGLQAGLGGGGVLALKVGEDWETPVGVSDREYAYEDLDLRGRVGASLGAGGFFFDFCYIAGLLDQLTVLGAPPAKAGDPIGEELPEPGQKIRYWTVGAGVRF